MKVYNWLWAHSPQFLCWWIIPFLITQFAFYWKHRGAASDLLSCQLVACSYTCPHCGSGTCCLLLMLRQVAPVWRDVFTMMILGRDSLCLLLAFQGDWVHVNRSRGIFCLDDVAIDLELGLVGITINNQTCNSTAVCNMSPLSLSLALAGFWCATWHHGLVCSANRSLSRWLKLDNTLPRQQGALCKLQGAILQITNLHFQIEKVHSVASKAKKNTTACNAPPVLCFCFGSGSRQKLIIHYLRPFVGRVRKWHTGRL